MRQRISATCFRVIVVATLAVICPGVSMAEEFLANYDESQVPPYTLPDPLVGGDGQPVTTVEQWSSKRRPELLRLFETEEYGRAPTERPKLEFSTTAEDRSALGGKAVRKEVTIDIVTPRGRVPLQLAALRTEGQDAGARVFGPEFLRQSGGIRRSGNRARKMRGFSTSRSLGSLATKRPRLHAVARQGVGKSRSWLAAGTRLPRCAAATSSLIHPTESAGAYARCFIAPAKPSRTRTNGERLPHGPGG